MHRRHLVVDLFYSSRPGALKGGSFASFPQSLPFLLLASMEVVGGVVAIHPSQVVLSPVVVGSNLGRRCTLDPIVILDLGLGSFPQVSGTCLLFSSLLSLVVNSVLFTSFNNKRSGSFRTRQCSKKKRVHAHQAHAAPPWRRCGVLCPAPPLLLGLAGRAPHRWSTTRPPSASTPRLWSSTPRLACATAHGRCTATASELHRPCPGARRQHCPRSASSHASSTACCYFAPLAAAASHSCCWRFPPPDYKPEISIRRLSPGARPLGSTFCMRLLYAPGRWMWPWMGIAASISLAISAGSAICRSLCVFYYLFIASPSA